jgi:hypothetical protein
MIFVLKKNKNVQVYLVDLNLMNEHCLKSKNYLLLILLIKINKRK